MWYKYTKKADEFVDVKNLDWNLFDIFGLTKIDLIMIIDLKMNICQLTSMKTLSIHALDITMESRAFEV